MKMILASHGELAEGLLSSYQMIAGKNQDISFVKLTDEGIEPFTKAFKKQLDEARKTDKILILTDIKGGTPYNEAYQYYLQHTDTVKVVAGMNLPMVIEVGLMLATTSLDEAFQLAVSVGKSAVEGIELDTEEIEEEIDF